MLRLPRLATISSGFDCIVTLHAKDAANSPGFEFIHLLLPCFAKSTYLDASFLTTGRGPCIWTRVIDDDSFLSKKKKNDGILALSDSVLIIRATILVSSFKLSSTWPQVRFLASQPKRYYKVRLYKAAGRHKTLYPSSQITWATAQAERETVWGQLSAGSIARFHSTLQFKPPCKAATRGHPGREGPPRTYQGVSDNLP